MIITIDYLDKNPRQWCQKLVVWQKKCRIYKDLFRFSNNSNIL